MRQSHSPRTSGPSAERTRPLHFSEQRRRNGVSLEDIARRSKIPLALLEDLEQERFDRFPAGIFARAYVRSYAEEARLDPEVVLARVIRQLPGDEALQEVREVVAAPEPQRRFPPAVADRLPLRRVLTLFIVAGAILFALGLSVTHRGAPLAKRVRQLISPPLTNGELAAANPAAALEIVQPEIVGTSGEAAPIAAVNRPATPSDIVLPAPDRDATAKPAARRSTAARARDKDRSPVVKVFSGIGGTFKKLFTGDDDKPRNGKDGRRR